MNDADHEIQKIQFFFVKLTVSVKVLAGLLLVTFIDSSSYVMLVSIIFQKKKIGILQTENK